MRGRQGDGSGEGEGVDGMACKGEKGDVGGTVMEAGWAGGRRVGCKGEERREGYAGGGVGGGVGGAMYDFGLERRRKWAEVETRRRVCRFVSPSGPVEILARSGRSGSSQRTVSK